MSADTVVCNACIVTMDRQATVITDGAIWIRDDRVARIAAGGPGHGPPAQTVIDARGGIVLPGLVNSHTHLPMTLFRGLADDLPLDVWLNEAIFPAESRHLNESSAYTGALLACAEMLLSGTTTCCDGYFFEDAVCRAVDASGMRAVLGQGVIDFPAPGVPDPGQNVSTAASFADRWLGRSPRIRPSLFCHSPYTCSAATLKAAKAAADDRGLLFQIHVAETRTERQQFIDAHGCSPVAYLDRLCLLDGNTLAVHAVWLDSGDIDILAAAGARVSHCPESNMKLGVGIAPVPEMIAAGVTVGLGTDGSASNNDLDLFGEMDTAAKIHKARLLDPRVMDAETVLRMATIEEARAIGLSDEIGSLEVGKQADLLVLDTATPRLTPLYRPESHLVYAAAGADVRDVMVAGRFVVKNRTLLSVDLGDLLTRCREIGGHIAAERKPPAA